MTTIGAVVTQRLDTVEQRIADISASIPAGLAREFDELRAQVALMRTRLDSGASPGGLSSARGPFHAGIPKEMMPGILGTNYRDEWRTWAYKARDWISMGDTAVAKKLEEVESITKEMTDE